jgi:hypothetical protein
MEAPSELERFLSAQKSDGEFVSEGQFTLERQHALKKLADYALPFSSAWAVKVIQCAVAGGGDSPIRVDLAAKETRFFFAGSSLDLGSVEESFFDPEPSANAAVRHLVSALWVVGLRHRWGFQLAVPGSDYTLIWDGAKLHRVTTSRKYDCAALTVNHAHVGVLAWVGGMMSRGSQNAELLLALAEHCFVCPVPLTVDGRRLDSLRGCPEHGDSKATFPIALAVAQADLPSLHIPPASYRQTSFNKAASSDPNSSGGSYAQYGDRFFRRLHPVQSAAVVLIVTYHAMLQKDDNRQPKWVEMLGSSTISWVRDGAVVDSELLMIDKLRCSVGCFVSADGLAADATGFSLLESQEKSRRRSVARGLVRTALQELCSASGPFGPDFLAEDSAEEKTASRVIMAGVGLTLTATVLGPFVAGPGLVLTGLGWLGSRKATSDEAQSVASLVQMMTTLADRLGR